jgi:hypothetical protein
MSFICKLDLGGKEYNVLMAEYDISQMVDRQHRPNGMPEGGMIQLTLESSSDNNLLEWAFKHNLTKNGKVTFTKRDSASQMKTIEFRDAFCIYLKEIFTADGKNPMVTRITISARELTVSSQTIKNSWAGMDGSSKTSSESVSTYKAD